MGLDTVIGWLHHETRTQVEATNPVPKDGRLEDRVSQWRNRLHEVFSPSVAGFVLGEGVSYGGGEKTWWTS